MLYNLSIKQLDKHHLQYKTNLEWYAPSCFYSLSCFAWYFVFECLFRITASKLYRLSCSLLFIFEKFSSETILLFEIISCVRPLCRICCILFLHLSFLQCSDSIKQYGTACVSHLSFLIISFHHLFSFLHLHTVFIVSLCLCLYIFITEFPSFVWDKTIPQLMMFLNAIFSKRPVNYLLWSQHYPSRLAM